MPAAGGSTVGGRLRASGPRLEGGVWRALLRPPAAVGMAVGRGVAGGAVVALAPPFPLVGVLGGGAAALAILTSLRRGLLALVAVAILLPFAVLPVRLGVQPTLLDATLGLLFLAWLLAAAHQRSALVLTAPGAWLAGLLLIVGVAHLLGAGHVGADELTRRVVKLGASLALFYCVVNVLHSLADVRLVERALIATATLAALLAIGIWALPRATQVRLLSALGGLGYPTGDAVLRFLPGPNNTYTDTLRAVGTSIDPNVLGGMLMLAAALAAGHLLGARVAPRDGSPGDSARPLAPRPLLVGALALLVVGMALSYSRSAWVGFAAALAYLAAFRSRRVLVLGLIGGALLLLSPFGQAMLARLASGFTAQDPASALRLAEYRNALAIVSRYPLFGIGFGPAPDLDLHEGVSSLYLTLAEQTGLVGTALFLLAVGTAWLGSLRGTSDPARASSVGALQAALLAALVAGL